MWDADISRSVIKRGNTDFVIITYRYSRDLI